MAVDASVEPNFTIVMRGYERDEVDSYLRDVVAESTRLGERVAQLEAELENVRARAASRGGPEEGFKHLGEETTRILVAAETAAREMREKAERQADAEVAAAEKAARERVENASDHADRIVAEAESRRRDIEEEIRRLETIRAEMVDRLRAAITTTERAIGETPSAAADASTSPAAAAPDSASTAARAPSPFEQEAAAPDDAADEPAAPTEEAAATVVDDDVEESVRVLTEAPATAAEPATEEVASEVEEPTDAAAEEPAAEEAAAPTAEEAGAADVDEEAAPAATEEHHGADKGALEAALAEADEAAGRAPTAVEPRDTDAGMVRERSLAGVRPGMLRRLRRSLQELQNGVLESVRTRTDATEVEDLLPTSAETTGLADVARVFLDAGYRAGRSDAPVLTGGEPLQDPPTDTTLVGETAEGLAGELLDELRTTLAPSLRAGMEADEPDASLSERVGEVFRDLKGPIIETVVDQHLTTTYGQATLDGWTDQGIGQVRWVLGEETRCPESICRGNEDEGPIELGSDFPSGHVVPPAHEGCTCVLDPA